MNWQPVAQSLETREQALRDRALICGTQSDEDRNIHHHTGLRMRYDPEYDQASDTDATYKRKRGELLIGAQLAEDIIILNDRSPGGRSFKFYLSRKRQVPDLLLRYFSLSLSVLARLLVEIVSKLRRGDFGLDLIAALSMSAALWFGQYLAGAIVSVPADIFSSSTPIAVLGAE
jgi:hypothetical protein